MNKTRRKKILVYGHFCTIHPGHIRYLRNARAMGDTLLVALMGDNKKNKFPFNQGQRSEALSLLGIADEIINLHSDELEKIIGEIKPDILVLGSEYKQWEKIEDIKEVQAEHNGTIVFDGGDVHYATSDLLMVTGKELQQERIEKFHYACKRHRITKNDLLIAIKSWKDTRLLVIGDTIVDQYAACEAVGMSAEAPVIVVKELESKSFLGGAGIVAAHIKALGAQCDFISVVGKDEPGAFVSRTLYDQDIDIYLINDRFRPTTFKKRYVVENQKLFRVSKLEERNIDKTTEDLIIERIESLIKKVDGIVVSDFVYGVITPRILKVIREAAHRSNKMLFGDVQCSSQIGSVTRLKDFTILCPNEREARLALQDKDSSLEQLSQKIMKETGTNKLVMKLGSEGFIAYDQIGERNISQAFPALSVNPLDVAGAGDSLLAVMATGLASNQDMMCTAALSCCMAALSVETMGNTPIDRDKLIEGVEDIFR